MPTTNVHGPKRAILHASVSTEEQARTDFSFHQLIKTIEQLTAPGSIYGTEGQHRNDGSRHEGEAFIRTGSMNVRMLSQLWHEVLFPLPNNGVLVRIAFGEAAPRYSRSLNLSTNIRHL